MKSRLVWIGSFIWLAATLLLRADGQIILRDGSWPRILLLFAISFAGVAVLVRRACEGARLRPEEWPAGAISILLPTLLLDPLSSAFFPAVFPNMAPELAGVFGGWMIVCCAGGLVGAVIRRPRQVDGPPQSS